MVLNLFRMSWGGSNIRPEATGYGTVYFANEILKDKGESLSGKRCAVSGSGNVALYCVEKLLDMGKLNFVFVVLTLKVVV